MKVIQFTICGRFGFGNSFCWLIAGHNCNICNRSINFEQGAQKATSEINAALFDQFIEGCLVNTAYTTIEYIGIFFKVIQQLHLVPPIKVRHHYIAIPDFMSTFFIHFLTISTFVR